MINGILQFIKKQKLAIRLAKFDSLFVIKGLKSFSKTIFIARFFVIKSKLSHEQRLLAFLKSENNPILYALADEISARPDVFSGPLFYMKDSSSRILKGELLFKNISRNYERRFYQELLREVVRADYPELRAQLSFLERRLDIMLDMRFYGSELETLNENSCDFESCCHFDIDWIKTGKHNLYLIFDERCNFTQGLSMIAQENLIRLFSHLFYERSLFVSAFYGVVVNREGKVSILDFDYIYQVDETLRSFATGYMSNQNPQPQALSEFKLQRAFKLLEAFCGDIKIPQIWNEYSSIPPQTATFAATDELAYLKLMTESGLNLLYRDEIPDSNPTSLAYLLDKSRHSKNKTTSKSSSYN